MVNKSLSPPDKTGSAVISLTSRQLNYRRKPTICQANRDALLRCSPYTQLRDHEENFRKRNVKIVVVTFESDLASRRYVEKTALTWPLVIDAQRALYRSYGMHLASFWDVWGPKTWWAYLKEIIKGSRPQKPEADIRQRGGDILIDPDGIVQLHHVGEGPADRPKVALILQIITPMTSENTLPKLNNPKTRRNHRTRQLIRPTRDLIYM